MMTAPEAPEQPPPNPAIETQPAVVPDVVPDVVIDGAGQPYVSKRGDAEEASRALTPGEVKLARGIFGDSLDVSNLRLHFYANADSDFASDVKTGEKRNVEFYGKDNYSDDYSQEKNNFLFGAFAYEMTHLWQNQQGGGWPHDTNIAEHNYPLSSQWSFNDYGAQQQRAIVEDYARRFLHESRESRWLPNLYSGDRADTDPFLKALVEDHFHHARDARIAFANIETRALTPGETAFIKSIFGDQLDLRALKVKIHPEGYSDVAGSVSSAESIDLWGPAQASKDYSTADNWRKTVFIHEVTHVWQFQTDWRYTQTDLKDYTYPLDTNRWKFNDYSTEQQAAMIEDYAAAFLIPNATPRWLPSAYSDYKSMLPQLRQTVEDRFPALRAHAQISAAPANMNMPKAKAAGLG